MKSLQESLIFEFNSTQQLKTYQELSDKYKTLYYKNENEPAEDSGSIHFNENDGIEIAFTITNWQWEANIIPKFEKTAKKADIVVSFNNDDDMTIINPTISKWMDVFNDKMTKFVEKAKRFEDKGGRKPTPVSKKDFDKFIDFSKETSYLQYNDYNYSDVKKLIDEF